MIASQNAARIGSADATTVKADSSGYFAFNNVSPGEYLLGVNIRRGLERDPVYPRTFYPGSPSAALAAVVTVGKGTHHDLEPLVLPAPLQRYELIGRVIWPDGTPVAQANVSLRDGDVRWQQVAVGVGTDLDGRFRFVVYEGLRYRLHAFINMPGDATGQAQAEVGPFEASSKLAPFEIILRPRP
jgi:hypothetical protein